MFIHSFIILFTRSLRVVSLGNCHGASQLLDAVKKSVALKYLVAKGKSKSLVKIITEMTANFYHLEGPWQVQVIGVRRCPSPRAFMRPYKSEYGRLQSILAIIILTNRALF